MEFPIIDKLGGREFVVRRLTEETEIKVSVDAARMWVARRRLPGDVVRALIGFAEADGVSFSSTDLDCQEQPGEGRAA